MSIISEIKANIVFNKDYNRSAWDRGVTAYAIDLLDEFVENHGPDEEPTVEDMLNGADNWSQYSYGGCSLIYDGDIAERLCTKSELRRNKGGELPPNSQEDWLDVQERALSQACRRIRVQYRNVARKLANA